MTGKVSIKAGDSLRLSVVAYQDDGVTPVDLTGWGIRAQVKNGDTLVDTLTLVAVNLVAGSYRLQNTLPTVGWPIGSLNCDLLYTTPAGISTHSDTFSIKVLKQVTNP